MIYFHPAYDAFNNNKLFELSDPILNRDGQLMPYARLKKHLNDKGLELQTSDYIASSPDSGSLLFDQKGVGSGDFLGIKKCACLVMEPPVVAPSFYRRLSSISNDFEEVYVHNVHGDGFIKNDDQKNFRKLFWPIPFLGVLDEYWNCSSRLNKVVVINGHHRPISKSRELYSKRIEGIAALSKYSMVDLFGIGWDKTFSRCSLWWPYIKNRNALLDVYCGRSDSKYKTLSKYDFCLCFENMKMDGYITEKIFDCFYAGTIPIYLGAKDVSSYIPKGCYIDFTEFSDWDELNDYLQSMTSEQKSVFRNNAKQFMQSDAVLPYYNSLTNIVDRFIDG